MQQQHKSKKKMVSEIDSMTFCEFDLLVVQKSATDR